MKVLNISFLFIFLNISFSNTILVPSAYSTIGSATIEYQTPKDSKVLLYIYNINGRLIDRLVDSNINAGYHKIVWNASEYSSGIHLVKMIADSYTNTQKIMLIK